MRRRTVSQIVAWLIANQLRESLSDAEIKAAPRALREVQEVRRSLREWAA